MLHAWRGVQERDEGDSSNVNHHFVQHALQLLVPVLLQQLSKQEEGQDKDDGLWNLSMAAGTCLGLVATVVGDAIVAYVMPYVQVSLPPRLPSAVPLVCLKLPFQAQFMQLGIRSHALR